MKKFKVTIKDNELVGGVIEFECDELITSYEDGTAIMIKHDDTTALFTLVASMLEAAVMKVVERKLKPEDRARIFANIKDKYDIKDEEAISSLHNSISDTLSILTEGVMAQLYEKTFKPKGSYNIKVFSPDNQVLKERPAKDFGLISTYEDGTIAFFDIQNTSEFKNLDAKLFQTICNCITYAAKLSIGFTEDFTDKEVVERMKKGDEEIYDLLNERVDSFCFSVKDFLKSNKISGLMKTNNLSMYIDEEEYYKQNSQRAIISLMKNLGLDKDDDDEEDEDDNDS